MPVPSTVPDLLDKVRRSGLIPADRLDGFLAGLTASGHDPATPAELLDRLVEAGMVTRFHADRLAQGKYKGFLLGSYLILDQLGTGGMGQVYLARHAAMQRLVALKVLPVFSAEDPVARERFYREARASAALDHPNIVRVYDLCQEGKIIFLVMEYVEGVSLQHLVARRGPLDIPTACQYVRQVAFGLQHAHDLGMVHRDIKPANLLVDRAGVVKVLDLGLVRSETEADAGLTRKLDNRVLGTADYVAPEQALDSSAVDIRADVYSLGATFYYLLAGRTLFPEGRTAQKLVWQQIKDPTPVDRLRPDVPPGVADLVHLMLQKNPADRPQTPLEVFDALAAWTEEPVPPPPEDLIPRPAARLVTSPSGTVSVPAARTTGSASNMVLAAMRTGGSGSGSVPGSATRRPESDPGSGSRSSDVIARPTPRPRPGETDAMALTETQPGGDVVTPDPVPPAAADPAPIPEPPRPARPWTPSTTQVVLLMAAAALVGLGVALLVVRGG
jgi:serine/threonine-protein kinase